MDRVYGAYHIRDSSRVEVVKHTGVKSTYVQHVVTYALHFVMLYCHRINVRVAIRACVRDASQSYQH